MRRTKIVATLGPAVDSREKIAALIDAGVNVVRLNMSHGDLAAKTRWAEWIRSLSAERDSFVAILADLAGPKIRTGRFAAGSAELAAGREFTIATQPVSGDDKRVSCTYPHLPRDVRAGNRILLDDGRLELEVVSTTETEVVTRVITGGVLKDSKGINLPGATISAPSLTEKDRADLEWCLAHDIDFVALSFVRTAADVAGLKKIIATAGKEIPVIAKIEKPEAIENLDAIIQIANGVMVARGDLGVEVGPEKVPMLQKRIIEAANRAGVTVITATQMLESMMTNPRPTRAEASDVANAILDKTDAVMLSGETAAGQYPIETVKMMVKIIDDAEARMLERSTHVTDLIASDLPFVSLLSREARNMVQDIRAAYIVIFSQSGRTARLGSKYRPRVPILCLSPRADACRRMALSWGVTAILTDQTPNAERMLNQMDAELLQTGIIRRGDVIIVLFGTATGSSGTTNSLRVMRVGESGTGWMYRTEV